MDYDENGEPILPLLSDIIKIFRNEREQRQLQAPLTPLSAAQHNDNIINPVDTHVPLPRIRDENTLAPPATNESSVTDIPPHNNPSPFLVEDNTLTGREDAVPGGEDAITDTGRPRRNVGKYKDGPAKIWRLPIDGKSYKLAYLINISFDSIYPVPAISNKASRPSKYHPDKKITKTIPRRMLLPAGQMVSRIGLFLTPC
jgi:hypothetical protein